MVAFVHKLTGTVMYVHESRVDEYKAAGHKPVAEPVKQEKKRTKKSR